MKTHSFDFAHPILILSFLTTSNLACSTKRNPEGSTMWAIQSLVADRIAASFNSHMVQSDGIRSVNTTVESNGAALQAPRLRSYREVIGHILKKYAHNEAISDADQATLRFTQLANMKLLQWSGAFFAKPTRVKDIYDKRTLNDTFIEEVNESIRHSLRGYPPTHPHAKLAGIAIQEQYFLGIQAGLIKRNQTSANPDRLIGRRRGIKKVNIIDSNFSLTRSCSPKHPSCSRSPPVMTVGNKQEHNASASQDSRFFFTLANFNKLCCDHC